MQPMLGCYPPHTAIWGFSDVPRTRSGRVDPESRTLFGLLGELAKDIFGQGTAHNIA